MSTGGAAGAPTHLYGPLDWNGGETAATMQSWPHRPTQYGGPQPPPEKEYTTSQFEIGKRIRCHAGDAHAHPSFPAGQSKRIHAYYQKTGGLDHRTEPQFKTTKGASSLTEANTDPLYSRPTFQSSAPLILTRGARERAGVPVPTIRADTAITSVPEGAQSYRSGSNRSGAKTDRSHYSQPREYTHHTPRGITASSRSARSSRAQEYDTTFHREMARMPWDFERRPMYETAAMDYGRNWDAVPHPAAGKSWSGFMEPTKLVAMLTEREQRADRPTA
jgi:hypothetical protein